MADHYLCEPAGPDRPALVSFSGGRSSAYMLRRILDAHGGSLPAHIKVAFANTGKERPETYRFVEEVSKRWAVEIAWLEHDFGSPHRFRVVDPDTASRDGEPFAQVIRRKKFLPNKMMRFCTGELKIEPLERFARYALGWERNWVSVMGIRADEPRRVENILSCGPKGRGNFGTLPCLPMAAAGARQEDVQRFWKESGFDLGIPSALSNCDLCFLKPRRTLMEALRKDPGLADWWIGMEREVASVTGGRKLRDPTMAMFFKDGSMASLLKHSRDQGSFLDAFDDEGEACFACTD